MRVLVTGGAGFIGANLCRALLTLGDEVCAVDDFSSGRYSNVEELVQDDNFRIMQGDVSDVDGMKLYDRVYHLACPASPPFYQKYPLKTLNTCYYGATAVSELANREGCKVLFTSTSEVYGDPTDGNHPQVESYCGNVNPVGIRACYDEGKRVSETYFTEAHKAYGFPLRIVRLFNTYGPYMRPDDGRVISNFICQALKGESLTVYGLGEQTRSLCFVDDMITGLINTMEQYDALVGPMNLGNPHEVTVLELAKLIIELTDSKSKICFKPMPEDDPTRRQPDVTMAKEKIDWWTPTALECGLLQTISWFKKVLAK